MAMLTVAELKANIKDLEASIAGKEKRGEDCSFERSLLKSWKTYLPGGRNHHKLAPEATKSKSVRFKDK